MAPEHIDRFFELFSIGLGALAFGGLNVFTLHCRVWQRLVMNGILAITFVGGILLLGGDGKQFLLILGLNISIVVLILTLALSRISRVMVWSLEQVRRPSIRYATVTVLGFLLVLSSIVVYDLEDERFITQEWDQLESTVYESDLYLVSDVHMTTDQATPIRLQLPVNPRSNTEAMTSERAFLERTPLKNCFIHREAANDRSNCHGWVFTEGKYCVGGKNVEIILRENGYHQVDEPSIGDLAIYRNHLGICHTAIVRYVTKGLPILVEGKWGSLGIYLHPVDNSPYGTDYSYYRSARDGHRLRGVETDSSNPPEPERLQATADSPEVP